jgi:uncharacterized paraquat-inducible protein A
MDNRKIAKCPACGLDIDITDLSDGIELDCPLCGGEIGTKLVLLHGVFKDISEEDGE